MNKKELLDKIKKATIKKIDVLFEKENSWEIKIAGEEMAKDKSDVSLKSINDLLHIIVTKVDNLETKVDNLETKVDSHIHDFENFKSEMYEFKSEMYEFKSEMYSRLDKIESLPIIQKELKQLNK